MKSSALHHDIIFRGHYREYNAPRTELEMCFIFDCQDLCPPEELYDTRLAECPHFGLLFALLGEISVFVAAITDLYFKVWLVIADIHTYETEHGVGSYPYTKADFVGRLDYLKQEGAKLVAALKERLRSQLASVLVPPLGGMWAMVFPLEHDQDKLVRPRWLLSEFTGTSAHNMNRVFLAVGTVYRMHLDQLRFLWNSCGETHPAEWSLFHLERLLNQHDGDYHKGILLFYTTAKQILEQAPTV